MAMRLYGKLAEWYPLITAADDYGEEADHFMRLVEAARTGRLVFRSDPAMHRERYAIIDAQSEKTLTEG